MTAEPHDYDVLKDRIVRTDLRVDKLEVQFLNELKSIHEKLNSMAINMAGKRDCPQPGLCLMLQTRMSDFERDSRSLTRDIVTIQKWQAGIMASLVLLGVLITFFGPAIRHMLGIEQ